MVYSQYAKWRLAGIAAVLVFSFLPEGMDIWIRSLFSLGLGSTPLWVLPSGGTEPKDSEEDLTWAEVLLGWPTLVLYSLLVAFIWWQDAAWWSFIIAGVACLVVIVVGLVLKGSFSIMKGTHNTCL